jgi:hypothetical protein
MDVVECVVENPLVFGIVDFEPAVRWHIFWLYRAEIGPQDICFRMLLCKLDGPDACPRTDIQDPIRLLDGGQVELAIKYPQRDGVLQVQPILLLL